MSQHVWDSDGLRLSFTSIRDFVSAGLSSQVQRDVVSLVTRVYPGKGSDPAGQRPPSRADGKAYLRQCLHPGSETKDEAPSDPGAASDGR